MNLSIDLQHDEADFIIACIAKDPMALKQLYEDYYPIMLPVCMRYSNSKNDALDILHDAFIKVFKNLEKYQIGTSLKSWIKRIMVNTAIDFYRRENRRRTSDLDHAIGVSNNDPDVVSMISADELLGALQNLSPAYRSVFNLYVIEGYSHRELAAILGITESTSRSNLVKARAKLRDIIAKTLSLRSKH